MNYNLYKTI